MNKNNKAELVFAEELKYIQSSGIKAFTLNCFKELTADYFWDFTASSSQKHHPKVSNKKHGIVIHTKLCVWWGRKLADNFGVKDLDVITSALLLHDLQKFGKKLDENNAIRVGTLGKGICRRTGSLVEVGYNNLLNEFIHDGNEPLLISFQAINRSGSTQLYRIICVFDIWEEEENE